MNANSNKTLEMIKALVNLCYNHSKTLTIFSKNDDNLVVSLSF
jgi:hypothetical protein